MKSLATTLVLAMLGLFSTPMLQAQTTVGTLTCQPAQGSSLTSTVYALEIYTSRAPNEVIGLAFLIADSASYQALFSAGEASTVFPTCTVVNGSASATFANTVVGASLTGYGKGVAGATAPLLFSYVVLGFTSVTAGGVTLPITSPFNENSEVKTRGATIQAARAKAFIDAFRRQVTSK